MGSTISGFLNKPCFERALQDVYKDGYRRRGGPADECWETKEFGKRYPVYFWWGTDWYFGYAIACESTGQSKTRADDQYSHCCGRFKCIRPSHITIDPRRINYRRRDVCHAIIHAWIRKNKGNLSGVKVTLEMCGGSCPHHPNCFYNVQ